MFVILKSNTDTDIWYIDRYLYLYNSWNL